MSLLARLFGLLAPRREAAAPAVRTAAPIASAPAAAMPAAPMPVAAAAPPPSPAILQPSPPVVPGLDRWTIADHRLVSAAFDASPFVGGVIAPRFIVMHYTAGGTAANSVRAIRERGLSAHFFVDRDGAVIQTAPCNREAYHVGESAWRGVRGLNRHSIGIEVSNLGWFDQRQGDDWVRDGLSRAMRPGQVLVARHKSGGKVMAWELYPEPQLLALERLTQAILRAYPAVEDVVGHDDVSPGRKVDPGPAFPLARYRAMLAIR